MKSWLPTTSILWWKLNTNLQVGANDETANILGTQFTLKIWGTCSGRKYILLSSINIFKYKIVNRASKLSIYKITNMTSCHLCLCNVNSTEEILVQKMGNFLREIYGPVVENGEWEEIISCDGKPGIPSEIKIVRIRWAGYLQTMKKEITPHKTYKVSRERTLKYMMSVGGEEWTDGNGEVLWMKLRPFMGWLRMYVFKYFIMIKRQTNITLHRMFWKLLILF